MADKEVPPESPAADGQPAEAPSPSPEKKPKASVSTPGPLPSVGDRVSALIAKEAPREVGTVRFVGTTEFADGDWIGVELDEPKGKNSGSVKDKNYFECRENHGIFVRQNMLQPYDPEKKASVVKKKGSSGKRASLLSKNSFAGSPGQKSQGSTTTPSSPVSPDSPTSPSSENGKRIKAKAAMDFQAQKRQYQELEAVRAAVRSLAQTVRTVQEKASTLEKSVVEKEATVDGAVLSAARAAVAAGERGASVSEKAFVEKWLQGVGDRMRDQMSQELKKRTETAISNAVAQGTRQLTEAAQPLQS